MTSPATFHLFSRLPHELQCHIWSLASTPPPYSESFYDAINEWFLAGISASHILHPQFSDHTPCRSRRPPERTPSLYECIFSSLQYLDGYEDTWNLLGACVDSRMCFLKILKREVDSVPSLSEQKKKGWYWGPGLSLEEVREGLVSEIEEVIGWLKVRKGSGVFKDLALDVRELHYMHVLARQIIIQQDNVPYSESHPEVFQRSQPLEDKTYDL